VGLIPVEECYYGKAKNLYPDIPINDNWSQEFLAKLSNDKHFYMECNSPHCRNKVPHEGLVIKIDNGKSEAFKLKCFKFISKESIDENINIEDEQ